MFSTQQEKALRAFSKWCLCYHRRLSKHALAFLLAASVFSLPVAGLSPSGPT